MVRATAFINASVQITLQLRRKRLICNRSWSKLQRGFISEPKRSAKSQSLHSKFMPKVANKWPCAHAVVSGISPHRVRSRTLLRDRSCKWIFAPIKIREISSRRRAEEITRRCIHEHKTRSVGGCYFRERPPYLVIEIAVPYTPLTHTQESLSLSYSGSLYTGLAQIAFCDTRCENKFMAVWYFGWQRIFMSEIQ
jgi:hypothetical protein